MKRQYKDFIVKVFFCIFVLTIPLVLCLYAAQARRYTALTSEIRELEKKQEKLIEENKKLVSDIAVLSSADRI